MKKFKAVMLLFVFLIIVHVNSMALSISVFEINVDMDTSIVNITGSVIEKASNKYAQLIVYKPDKNVQSLISGENANLVISKAEDMELASNGNFTLNYTMGDVEKGTYTAQVIAGGVILEKIFYYVPKTEVLEAIEAINSADSNFTEEQIFSLYNQYKDELCLNIELFNNLGKNSIYQKKVLDKLLSNTNDYTTQKDIFDIFALESALQTINKETDPTKIVSLITNYNDILKFDKESDLYKNYINNNDSEICRNLIKSDYETIEAAREGYSNSVLLTAINNLDNYSKVYTLLSTYNGKLSNIDFTKYLTLGTQKKDVDLKIVNATFDYLNEVKPAFERFVNEVNPNTNTNDQPKVIGGNTGSSGGKSFSPAPVVSPSPTQLPPSDEIKDNVFNDLDDVFWAKDEIIWLYYKGIVAGKEEKIFKPNDNITRAEFTKMICIAMNLDYNDVVSDFTDVKTDDWSYKYISAAYFNKIVEGYSDGSFGKEKNISRQDIAVLVYRAIKTSGISLETNEIEKFSDEGEFSDYAIDSAGILKSNKFIDGIGDNKFAPLEFATRAQAAKLIYKFCELIN